MSRTEDQHIVGQLLAPELSELIEAKQNRQARAALVELLEPEIADALMAMEPQLRAIAFRLLPRSRQTDVFVLLPEDQQEELLQELSTEQIVHLINEMEPDDRASLIDEMPGELVTRLLSLMRPEQRRQTQIVLGYPPESVGRLMTPDYLTLRPDWTCAEAIDHIRRRGRNVESLHTMYVVDDRGRLIDDVRLRELVLAAPEDRVQALMDQQTALLHASDDREVAVRTMERYDLPALPVVDRDDVLVGIVTFDDVADVAEEEVTEDFHKLGGVAALEQPYLSTTITKLVRKRVGWLAILFAAGLLTVAAMSTFEEQIESLPLLAVFVPLIIASGGNSGFQAATVMTRAIALREVEPRHFVEVFKREMLGGLLLGGLLAVLGVLMATGVGLWMYAGEEAVMLRSAHVGAAVGTAILCVVLFGNMVGSLLPFALIRLGLDPATGSTPFVATIVDVAGLLLYFSIASVILGV